MATVKCSVTRSSWYEMYIEYSYTQNQESCYSYVSHKLKLKQLTDSYDFNGTMKVTYYVNGNAYSYDGKVNINDKGNTGYTVTIKSGTTTIYHDLQTGQAKIKFSCEGSCPSGGYGPGTIKLSEVSYDLTTIPRISVWTEMPYRWYINNADGGLRNSNPSGSNYTQVKYDKKAAYSNRMWLKYNGEWGDYFATGQIATTYSLFNSGNAIYNALSGISANGSYYYANKTDGYAHAKYYDTQVLLRSYNSSGTKMGDNESNIRVEISMPRVPTGLTVTSNNSEDYSYKSNVFNLSWNVADYCSHYIIKYEVYQQNNSAVISESREIEVSGHSTTTTQISIPSLLAGQYVKFYIKGRWKYTATSSSNGAKTFIFDSNAWSNFVRIQKQGGMVTMVGSQYKNCHVFVTDNTGKAYKADAVYVYTNQDNTSNIKEYRLVKMK